MFHIMSITHMDYSSALISTIAKTHNIKTQEYAELKLQLQSLANDLFDGHISNDAAMHVLYKILSKVQRKRVQYDMRADERVQNIQNLITIKPKTILDIGAGSGKIIAALKNAFGLHTKNVYAIDKKLPVNSNVSTLEYASDGSIPLEDHSIDLIICFMTLHHISPYARSALIKEMRRILAPGGTIVIREHDSDNTREFYIFMNMLHMIWYISNNETQDPLYLMPKEEIERLFNDNGFHAVNMQTYTNKNPQRIYFETFN